MKIKLYSKEECKCISFDKHSANTWDLLFGLPDEVFEQEIHEVQSAEEIKESYLLTSGWAVPKFFVKEVVECAS